MKLKDDTDVDVLMDKKYLNQSFPFVPKIEKLFEKCVL